MTALIAVTSGTPRVGKSLLSANLAHYLNESGHRTGLLTAGSRAPLWQVPPQSTWPHILEGRSALTDAIQQDRYGVDIMVTQGQGQSLGEISPYATEQVADAIQSLDDYTYLILDMAAGRNVPAMAGCLAATETLLVITPDTPTLTAAYEWLSQLCRNGFAGPVNLVMNRIDKPSLAQSVFMRFRNLAQKKLNLKTNLWGTMSRVDGIPQVGTEDRPLPLILPQAKLVSDIRTIGDRLTAEQPPENQTQPLEVTWRRFVDGMRALPAMPPPRDHEEAAPAIVATEATATILPVEALEAVPVDSPPETEVETGKIPPSAAPSPAEPHRELNELTEQLAAIATELSGIRRLLEARSPGPQAPEPEENKRPGQGIKLDFDTFLASRSEAE